MYARVVRRAWFSFGSVLLAAAVAAGAFGAHALRSHLDAASLALWETAVRYLAIGGLGLLALGLAAHTRPSRGWGVAGIFLSIGALVFSGTVGVLALGGPRWLGMVTPLGGVLLIAGFLAMALAAARS
ncbi:MAG: hypothetical protein A2Y78_06685 [Acidobacteria bacterium RBG_13_68_16]|jgi:uncharacterized membrane protein YgdD (TMEM256/DUF423 family)|nr:MAG: hypothetical protein A2Y78_06685 [Acidobacteria bacterium RBG_13_68_16]